ncbi:MAG: carboxymuconolactone decarboxylase family protein [Thermoanaerobacteraceae bacterium]|nr:carboxymuconolactone decarboxylase family protein [Thermoanaerobacteraceae bacterium]
MMQGELPRDLKEMVAVVVSQANSCQYCVNAHGSALKMLGMPREKVVQLLEDIDGSDVSEAVKKVLKLSVKATREPYKITDDEWQELKAQIVELFSVVDLYTSFNKFLDTLQVDIDFPAI